MIVIKVEKTPIFYDYLFMFTFLFPDSGLQDVVLGTKVALAALNF